MYTVQLHSVSCVFLYTCTGTRAVPCRAVRRGGSNLCRLTAGLSVAICHLRLIVCCDNTLGHCRAGVCLLANYIVSIPGRPSVAPWVQYARIECVIVLCGLSISSSSVACGSHSRRRIRLLDCAWRGAGGVRCEKCYFMNAFIAWRFIISVFIEYSRFISSHVR